MMEIDDKQRCCGKCRFFFKEYDHRGQCRRYPPQAWSESNPETTSCLGFNFPEMRNEEWCVEFQPEEGWVLPKGWQLKNMPEGPGGICEVQDIS